MTAKMAKRGRPRMNKGRTNISLTGDELKLLENIKLLISIKLKTSKAISNAEVVRMALQNYKSVLSN